MKSQHEAFEVDQPVSIKPIPVTKLKDLLNDCAESFYPVSEGGKRIRKDQVRYNALRDAAGKLDGYLTHQGSQKITIDEDLLESFANHLKSHGVKETQRRIYRSNIRKLINGLPSKLVQRKLKTLAAHKRQNRFHGFSESTGDALQKFRKSGMKLRRGTTHRDPALSNNLLADNNRKQIVDSTLTFLNAINIQDITSITEAHVEQYLQMHKDKGTEKTAYKTLDFIRPFFTHLRCWNLLNTDPLRTIPRATSGQNHDFVDQEAIEKLADLSTLDMEDFTAVRGRTIAFALDYAYALRNKESSLIRCSDFNGVELKLPKEIQKIKKDTLPIYSYFPQTTKELIKRYLELRSMKSPKTDVFMIANDGKPLGASGCRDAVQKHCNELGIKTHDGNQVNPHRLRHSFGTLNIEPIGLSLSLTEISEQLRHANIQITYDTYIAKNPLHKRVGYEKRMRQINGTPNPVEEEPKPSKTINPPKQESNFIAEKDAIRQLRTLGLTQKSLRKYAIENGHAQQTEDGFMYSEEFTSSLITEYFTKTESLDLLGMKRGAFFEWTQNEGIEFLLIGKVSLYQKEDIMAKRRVA